MKDLSLHILDIVQNSVVAQASNIEIRIEVDKKNDYLAIIITDNGKGMSPEFLQSVTDPYTTTRTTRKVGLGIPLLKQNTERAGGSMQIESALGQGTSLKATLNPNNIDCLPIGDVAGVVSMLICSYPDTNFLFIYKRGSDEFSISTADILAALDGVAVNNPSVYPLIKELISSNLDELQISELG
ncbi:histidine kinase [Tenuifilaceae bacterium CYCD]|nr:histidine kinase [Tenuifilaceae bacterium CYCD]